VDEMGGATEAIATHFFQNEIRTTAYRTQQEVDRSERVIVGVNKFQSEEGAAAPLFSINDSVRQDQIARLKALKARRDAGAVSAALADIKRRAQGTDNLMPAILGAVENLATLGEISGTLRDVWGEYRE